MRQRPSHPEFGGDIRRLRAQTALGFTGNNTRTFIRGGVGRYAMTILGAVFYSLTGISSSDVREFTNNIQNGVPLFQLPQISTNGNGVTSTPYGQAYFGTANDPHFNDSCAIQWNLSVERDLGWNTGLRVSCTRG